VSILAIDYLTCDELLPGGCKRCFLSPSRLCCDVCNPPAFAEFNIPPLKASRQPARSRIDTKYIMSTLDLQLREALEDWRSLKTEDVYGYSGLVDFGPTLVMPAEVVERVIHCSHYSKILNVAELKKETRWDDADKWGAEVIEIITRIYPATRPPPLTTTIP